jgi:probable F420-dependent oxidoreductase
MRIGVVFPQTEIGNDAATIRDYAQTAEELGFQHVLAYDHVIGANLANRPGWHPPYSHADPFHEPLVLFGYIAGVTRKLELVTGIIILPQRQTVLVAKQAAALDVLSGGRLRLGVGLGWNPVEYEALGQNFNDRGRRIEEQVAVLRRLWTEELVTFEGGWHKIIDAGINPGPLQRPIPVWFGGSDERALRRLARLGDGWFPLLPPDAQCRAMVETIRRHAREAGRSPRSTSTRCAASPRRLAARANFSARRWWRLRPCRAMRATPERAPPSLRPRRGSHRSCGEDCVRMRGRAIRRRRDP